MLSTGTLLQLSAAALDLDQKKRQQPPLLPPVTNTPLADILPPQGFTIPEGVIPLDEAPVPTTPLSPDYARLLSAPPPFEPTPPGDVLQAVPQPPAPQAPPVQLPPIINTPLADLNLPKSLPDEETILNLGITKLVPAISGSSDPKDLADALREVRQIYKRKEELADVRLKPTKQGEPQAILAPATLDVEPLEVRRERPTLSEGPFQLGEVQEPVGTVTGEFKRTGFIVPEETRRKIVQQELAVQQKAIQDKYDELLRSNTSQGDEARLGLISAFFGEGQFAPGATAPPKTSLEIGLDLMRGPNAKKGPSNPRRALANFLVDYNYRTRTKKNPKGEFPETAFEQSGLSPTAQEIIKAEIRRRADYGPPAATVDFSAYGGQLGKTVVRIGRGFEQTVRGLAALALLVGGNRKDAEEILSEQDLPDLEVKTPGDRASRIAAGLATFIADAYGLGLGKTVQVLGRAGMPVFFAAHAALPRSKEELEQGVRGVSARAGAGALNAAGIMAGAPYGLTGEMIGGAIAGTTGALVTGAEPREALEAGVEMGLIPAGFRAARIGYRGITKGGRASQPVSARPFQGDIFTHPKVAAQLPSIMPYLVEGGEIVNIVPRVGKAGESLGGNAFLIRRPTGETVQAGSLSDGDARSIKAGMEAGTATVSVRVRPTLRAQPPTEIEELQADVKKSPTAGRRAPLVEEETETPPVSETAKLPTEQEVDTAIKPPTTRQTEVPGRLDLPPQPPKYIAEMSPGEAADELIRRRESPTRLITPASRDVVTESIRRNDLPMIGARARDEAHARAIADELIARDIPGVRVEQDDLGRWFVRLPIAKEAVEPGIAPGERPSVDTVGNTAAEIGQEMAKRAEPTAPPPTSESLLDQLYRIPGSYEVIAKVNKASREGVDLQIRKVKKHKKAETYVVTFSDKTKVIVGPTVGRALEPLAASKKPAPPEVEPSPEVLERTPPAVEPSQQQKPVYKLQSQDVYHQSDTGQLHIGRDIQTGEKTGVHFSTSPPPEGFYGSLIKVKIKPDLVFFDATDPGHLAILDSYFRNKHGVSFNLSETRPGGPNADPGAFSQAVLDFARDLKYDGVRWGRNDYVVFNPDNISRPAAEPTTIERLSSIPGTKPLIGAIKRGTKEGTAPEIASVRKHERADTYEVTLTDGSKVGLSPKAGRAVAEIFKPSSVVEKGAPQPAEPLGSEAYVEAKENPAGYYQPPRAKSPVTTERTPETERSPLSVLNERIDQIEAPEVELNQVREDMRARLQELARLPDHIKQDPETFSAADLPERVQAARESLAIAKLRFTSKKDRAILADIGRQIDVYAHEYGQAFGRQRQHEIVSSEPQPEPAQPTSPLDRLQPKSPEHAQAITDLKDAVNNLQRLREIGEESPHDTRAVKAAISALKRGTRGAYDAEIREVESLLREISTKKNPPSLPDIPSEVLDQKGGEFLKQRVRERKAKGKSTKIKNVICE